MHILRKRDDGYHDIETIFYPIPLQDGLEIIRSASGKNEFTQTGLALPAGEENICEKAYKLLKADFHDLPPVSMHLHKVIPAGAGLGGGSADAAFTLLAINKKLNLGIDHQQLKKYALQLGSDCPFFIDNMPAYATGRGENLVAVDLDLSSYKIVIVNPGIHVSTAAAFRNIQPNEDVADLKDIIKLPVSEWRGKLINDFEKGISEMHPEIAMIKDQLYNKGAIYASMSGSGSTMYGIFEREKEVELDFPEQYFFKVI